MADRICYCSLMMSARDVIDLCREFERAGIMIWIDGGWAVDALLGKETRPHEDLDIAIQHADIPKLRETLRSRGYKDVARDDASENNFVLGDAEGRRVDVHSIEGLAYPKGSLAGQGT